MESGIMKQALMNLVSKLDKLHGKVSQKKYGKKDEKPVEGKEESEEKEEPEGEEKEEESEDEECEEDEEESTWGSSAKPMDMKKGPKVVALEALMIKKAKK